ncbi:type 2 lanthipeptide synthetase LanM family protein [Streptomyces sp. NPDC020951]|uniref:type 2 lanthipeptide synthetase LanM family protein n=1 Tax=Streptomyces sp. NPDC020951 TaxID=3365104 RepID=UPI0037AB124D
METERGAEDNTVKSACPPGGSWWARGLHLAERLDQEGGPARPADGRTRARAEQRLLRWAAQRDVWADDLRERGAGCDEHGVTEEDLTALLTESASDLAARTTRPAWADWAEQALADAPEHAPAVPGGLEWDSAFGVICAPFAEPAGERLARAVDSSGLPADTAMLRKAFVDRLTKRLVAITAHCLVVELNTAREQGRLAGDEPQDRFVSFVRQTAQKQGMAGLLARYPVLARLLAQAGQYALDAEIELVGRLVRDRADIARVLLRGTDPGPLLEVSPRGDTHCRGRTVAVLRFADGNRVVYKPRPAAVHRHFTQLLEWLNIRVPGLGLRTPRVLDRSAYGWAEYIENVPCRTTAQVDQFYRRLGALMAVLHALNATDMHCENLMACADQPVLVDLETLFHPVAGAPADDDGDPAQRALDGSVLRIALLPTLVFGQNGGWDVSALSGGQAGALPLETPDWAAPGTDEMHLVHRPAHYLGTDNRPRLGAAEVDPTDFSDALLDGFRTGYETITGHREEFTAPGGPVHAFASDEVRMVVRPTRLYTTMLNELTHPDVLGDALDRDREFGILRALPVQADVGPRIVPQELVDLWAGDIPLFTHRPSGRDVVAGSGQVLTGVLAAPALEQVLAKIDAMGTVDLYDQEWITRAALATSVRPIGRPAARPGPVPHTPRPAPVAAPEQYLAAARTIADQILAGAFHDEQRINWLGIHLVENRHWAVLPLGAGLSDGYTGVALFLAQLGQLTSVPRYAEAARRAIAPVPRLLSELSERPEHVSLVGCGAFSGLGGLAYALTHLAHLLRDSEVSTWVEPTVALATEAAQRATDPTVAGGLAGCLAAMLAVHRHTGLPGAAKAAALCAERLLAADPPQLPAGFSEGLHGIGWALARYADAEGGSMHDYHAAAALLAQPADHGDHSWGSGLTGVGFALADSRGAVPSGARPDLDRAVRAAARGGMLPAHSLGCGELGRLELLTLASGLGIDAALESLPHRAAAFLADLRRNGPRCAVPAGAESPDLMNGLSGIGHGLLRLAAAGRVPSVLALRPPRNS